MTNPRDEIERLEEGLRNFQVDKNLKTTKTIEFDLKGSLNPTKYIERFYEMNGHLQDFGDFVEEYTRRNFNEIKDYHIREVSEGFMSKRLSDDEIRLGIKARLYRTAMGIYTEHHCFLLLKEILGRGNAIRNSDLDRSGVDFIIVINNRRYNTHVIIDNERARKKLKWKVATKNSFGYPGQHIVLPYSTYNETTEDLGTGFFVYTEKYLRDVLRELEALDNIEDPFVVIYNKVDETSSLVPYKDWVKQV